MAPERLPIISIPACLIALNGKPAHRVAGKYIECLLANTSCVPLLVPAFGDIEFAAQILGRLDGIFLTGSGSNVEPHRYGGPPSRAGTAHDTARDGTSLPLIRNAVEAGVPVFAVCRGIQEFNVAMGGTLHQNIHEVPGKNEHRMNRAVDTDERFSVRHPIEIQPGGLLSQITDGSQREMVNSLHAQAIDKVADGLAVEAISDDGVIEAVSATRPNSFALGVQWHPEYPITKECVLSRRLFAAFNQATLRHLNARLSDTNKTQAA
jgi:putative glutamine amidotransferase